MSQGAVQHRQYPHDQTHQYTPTSDRYGISDNSPSTERRYAGNASSGQNSRSQPPMTTPRGSSLAAQSPPVVTMSASPYNGGEYYPDQRAPVNLPIRSAVPATPNSTQNNAVFTPRQQSGYDHENERSRTSDGQQQQQRSGYNSGREDQTPNSGRSQRTRNVPATSRSTTSMGQPPIGTDLPRENSAVIQRIVVDDPQADLIREEIRQAEATPHPPGANVAIIPGIDSLPNHNAAPAPQVQRSRQEHLKQPSSNRKEIKFGEYILGQTLGEGEFGKVKMGWKKDSPVQVAIKLIRKESLAGNNTRLPKIYREISILRELQHPNIVRLHEFVETERHMGIILEYASGGELFDYILNQRYLKDPQAKRLFAQLVSGVGYLHQKGIVHRDLKLENLLLDRNKHIIITDFGFANTFDAKDELGEDVEMRVGDKEFVKRAGLDKVIPWEDGREGGHRRGDLMNTSCGSPCYAAPELVVSDGLYTGRKVDVWSCGVILYAMLAGYLPFDDDPANPEGDNINLLYKYIVNTPLTFPDYVTPHARDLLRRILVADPRQRADLFEVARHSWLSDYTHVVGFIGSKVKSEKDLVAAALGGQEREEDPQLGRSSSVREAPAKQAAVEKAPAPRSRHVTAASIGGEQLADLSKQQRDVKRNTVQLEYVAPNRATTRGEVVPSTPGSQNVVNSPTAGPSTGRTRSRVNSGPVEVAVAPAPPAKDVSMPPPSSRPGRDQQRAISDSNGAFGKQPATPSSRPNTGNTLGGNSRLPSRGNSYSQPVAAQPTNTIAQGSISQPKSSPGYTFATPVQQSDAVLYDGQPISRPMSQQNRSYSSSGQQQQQAPTTKHRRTGTWGSITDRMLNRSNSRRSSQQETPAAVPASEKRDRRYPPVSLRNAIPTNPNNEPDATPRASMESRRTSFGFTRKASREREPSVQGRRSRRFSFLPSSFSFTGRKEPETDSAQQYDPYQAAPPPRIGRPQSKGMAFGRGTSRSPSGSTTGSTIPLYYEADRETARAQRRSGLGQVSSQSQQQQQQPPMSAGSNAGVAGRFPLPPSSAQAQQKSAPQMSQMQQTQTIPRKALRDDGYGGDALPGQQRYFTPQDQGHMGSVVRHERYEDGDEDEGDDGYEDGYGGGVGGGNVQGIRPQQRRFGEGYESGHAGSSSTTRRVMDFFRRRREGRSEV